MKSSVVEFNLSNLYNHPNGNFTADKEGKLIRISKWNVIGRIIKYISDRFCGNCITNRVNEVILKTFQQIRRLLTHSLPPHLPRWLEIVSNGSWSVRVLTVSLQLWPTISTCRGHLASLGTTRQGPQPFITKARILQPERFSISQCLTTMANQYLRQLSRTIIFCGS